MFEVEKGIKGEGEGNIRNKESIRGKVSVLC